MEPVDIQKFPIVHEEVVEVTEESARIQLPYDTRPFDGQLQPGEEITLHGGVTIVNDTNQIIDLRIQFMLPGGYHLYMQDAISDIMSDSSVNMQATYSLVCNDQGQFELNLYPSE